jgi:hypothetical protein
MNPVFSRLIRNYRELPNNRKMNVTQYLNYAPINTRYRPKFTNTENSNQMITFKFAHVPNAFYGLTKTGYLFEFLPTGHAIILGHTNYKFVPISILQLMNHQDQLRMFRANRANNLRSNIPGAARSSTRRHRNKVRSNISNIGHSVK